MRTRIGFVMLVAAVPLAAVVLDPSGWFPFGPSKWIVVSTLVPAGAALVLWHRPTPADRRLLLTLAGFLAWLIIATFVGHDGAYAWVGTPERHFGLLTWVLCAVALVAGLAFDSRHDAVVLGSGLAAAAAGAGALATAQALGFEPSVFAVTAGRLTATMGSAAYLGALSALLLPAAVGIACDRALPRSLRWMAGAAVIPIGVACLGSGARAAWVGLGAAGLVLVALRRDALRAAGRRAVIAVIVGAIALAAIVALSPVGDRLSSLSDSGSAGGRSRLDEWRVATRVIARHPLTGVGPEGYRIAFAEGVDEDYERSYGRSPLPDRAHSGPLDVALAGGLPALVGWAALVGLIVQSAGRAMRTERAWLVGLGAAVTAHLAGQLLLFPIAELEPIAWLAGGVVIASTASTASPSPRGPGLRAARPLAAALGLAAIVAFVAGVRDVVADRHAHDAVTSLGVGATRRAVAAAASAVDARPDEVRLHLLLAQALEADQRGTVVALRAVDDALKISPNDPASLRLRAELLIDRANSTHLPADVGAARQATGALVARDSHNADLWLLDGLSARLAGDAVAAEASFRRAEQLGARRGPERG